MFPMNWLIYALLAFAISMTNIDTFISHVEPKSKNKKTQLKLSWKV